MGLTAISSSASAGASSAISLFSSVGVGAGGIFVAIALVALLAYYNVYDASASADEQARVALLATIVPLALTFGAIVLFESLAVVG